MHLEAYVVNVGGKHTRDWINLTGGECIVMEIISITDILS